MVDVVPLIMLKSPLGVLSLISPDVVLLSVILLLMVLQGWRRGFDSHAPVCGNGQWGPGMSWAK